MQPELRGLEGNQQQAWKKSGFMAAFSQEYELFSMLRGFLIFHSSELLYAFIVEDKRVINHTINPKTYPEEISAYVKILLP